MKPTILGIDQLKSMKFNQKVGVLCHAASVTGSFEHIVSILERRSSLAALFGPQHGIYGETQDNMIEWEDQKDSKGRPIFSLYGERRKPSHDSLEGLELVIIDLFDIGARYYTFIYTMSYMLEVCAELKIPVLICDRPNPLGGEFIEGPILDPEFKSFVGRFELPVCHGMTIGELALWMTDRMSPKPEVQILKLKNWKRKMRWPDTGLTWTMPSPNINRFEAAHLYPGMCLIEGTTVSEGRGTTRPFELIGAPFFDWNEIENEYRKSCKVLKLAPIIFHRQGFIPTFHKHSGEVCNGVLQIVPRAPTFYPVRHAVLLLWIWRVLYGENWNWKDPPYEYEYEKLPIDILCGGVRTRQVVDQQLSLADLFASWKDDEARFKKQRRSYLIYK